MRQAFVLVFACSLLCGQTLAWSKDHSVNGLVLEGAFTPDRAMELIYKGRFDHFNGSSEWTPNQVRNYPNSWPDQIDVAVLLNAAYVESNVPKHLLVTWARPEMHYDGDFSCHQCPVLIGLALFAKQPNGWRVEASDLQFGYYGSGGEPPPVSLQPLGLNRYGLLIRAPYDMSGEAWDAATLVVPQGTFLKAFASEMDDTGCEYSSIKPRPSDDCISYESSLDFVPDPKSDYYVLILTKHIYRSLSKKNPVGTTITRYRFDGSKYVPVQSASPANGSAQPPN